MPVGQGLGGGPAMRLHMGPAMPHVTRMSDHVLVLDSGTTSTRAIAFDLTGRVAAVAQRALTQHYPRPGWVEHDAQEIWRFTLACAEEVARKVRAERIA